MKVIVASQNPVKIAATRIGFHKMYPEYEYKFVGTSVPSGVSDQPMTDEETLQGAINRAKNAKKLHPDASFWVGIEGGIHNKNDEMEAFAWVYLESEGLSGKARTSTFLLPPKIIALIKQGIELGEADDMVFGRSNSKQKDGAVGILTGNIIDRTNYYVEAVILALIPFKNQELYNN